MSPANNGSAASCAQEPVPEILLEILENLGDSIAFLDRDWRFVYLNSQAVAMARIPRDWMIGAVIWDLFPELASGPVYGHLHRTMGDRVPTRFEEYYAPYDLWIEVSAYPARDGLVVLARDITERKRAEVRLRTREEQAIRRLGEMEQIYVTAPIGLGFLDRELRYRQVNEQLAAIHGVPAHAHLGRTPFEVIPEAAPALAPLLTEVLRTARPMLRREVQAATRAHQGQVRSYCVSYYPVAGGDQVLGINVAVEDVTAQKIAETALRESEKRYRTLFETTGDGILILNDAGRYVDVNESYCRILKATRGRLIGAHFSDFIPPDRLAEAEAAFTRLQTGGSTPIDFPLRALDGTIVDLSWTSSSYYLPGLYFCVCRDLTEERRAEKALQAREQETREQETREAAEQINRVAPSLAGERDLERLVHAVTEIATRLSGAQFGAFFHNVLTARGESYLLHSVSGIAREGPAVQPSAELFAATFRGAGVVRLNDLTGDPRYPTPFDGGRTVRSYLAVPVLSRSGEVLGGLFFGHSDAGRFAARHEALVCGIAAQAAIAMDNARLLEQAQWVQAELTRSNQDLRRANRDLETFAYSASHDLQEPLRNIAIYAQLMERRLGSSLDGENTKFLQGILKGTERMHQLVEDLLSYSRATRQAEGPVPTIDAAAVLATVLQTLRVHVEQAGAEVTAGPLPKIRMHEVHVTQLFQNLIGNAIKYRSEDAPRIRISAVRQEGWWSFSVADNGIGIDPQYRPQVFGLFKRLHSRDQYSGSGVGLAICQRIVDHYGGRIWAEGVESGTGSVIRFTIPDLPGS